MKAWPLSRTNSLRQLISDTPLSVFIVASLAVYFGLAFSFALTYWAATVLWHVDLLRPAQPLLGALYFSFVTQLTVGYGDIVPIGIGRLLAVAQAVVGTGIFGIWISYAVVKILSPSPRTLVFSPKAFYTLDTKEF